MSKKRPLRVLLMLGLGAAVLASCSTFNHVAYVPSGYKAKVLCSEVFVAGRDAQEAEATNFADISPAFDWVSLEVDEDAQIVTGSLKGFGRSNAVYRDGIGCTLDVDDEGLAPINPPVRLAPTHAFDVNIDADVQSAVLAAFDDSSLPNPVGSRGLVVIQNGEIVGEHYAPGFDENTRQQSWSTAKGVVEAMTGIAIGQGLLALDETELLPQWQQPDPRSEISLSNMLQMASGLEFSEAYANPLSDVDQMLFNQRDMGAFSAGKPLIEAPGEVSRYSSGTTNIVSIILRDRIESAGGDYHAYPYAELFDPLSMTSAIFEVDAAGNFIGSSYIYATPRDFAKFGQLYLQDGVWEGERILPQGWVDYTGEPAPGSNGAYGAHWSINIGQSSLPGLPEDVIHLGGNDGQMIVVIPSKNAVIVRMGVTRPPATFDGDLYPLIGDIYRALN